jgi:hypothetical protein
LKQILLILFIISQFISGIKAQTDSVADFSWGNSFYYNLSIGESIHFKNTEVKLLQVVNHYNQLKVGEDTLWLKVARRSLPEELNGIRIFVADNKKVKSLASDQAVHGLLKKDALVCLSDLDQPLLDRSRFVFPVSFNDGFQWSAEEDTYPFSYYRKEENQGESDYASFPGLGINLDDARGRKKHWLVAVENSRVVWVNTDGNEAQVLIESEQDTGIYYIYSRLFNKNIAVKKGQKLLRGDAIGTAWGDRNWGHAVISVVKASEEPSPGNLFHHAVNAFPQWFDLYFQQGMNMTRFFTRGRLTFGRPAWIDGNKKNTGAFESYTGKGWIFDRWNLPDKVESVIKGNDGHVRLKKVMFEGTPAQSRNPDDYFEYRMNVRNGTYRIRARVGDFNQPSWQKIEFEGITAAVKSLDAGEFDWTPERVVKVQDGTLNVRIYVDPENAKVAGLSEIVFQRAF